MPIYWVLKHVHFQNVLIHELMRENGHEHFLEATKRVDWATLPLRSLEEILSPWVQSLVWIFSWPASSSATCGRVSQLPIRSFGMLLLHMSIKSGIRQVGLVAILAFEVPPIVVVLTSSLTWLLGPIQIIIVTAIVAPINCMGVLLVCIVILLLICHNMSNIQDLD